MPATGPPRPQGDAIFPALRKLTRDKQEFIRVSAAYAVWRITGDRKDAGAVLQGVAEGKVHPYMRVQALQLLTDLARTAGKCYRH